MSFLDQSEVTMATRWSIQPTVISDWYVKFPVIFMLDWQCVNLGDKNNWVISMQTRPDQSN